LWHLCWSNAVKILFCLSYATILIAFARQKKTFNSSQLVRAINLSLAANINLFLFFGVCGQRINNVIAGVDMTSVCLSDCFSTRLGRVCFGPANLRQG